MKCEKCGCLVKNGDTVCGTCGAEVSVSSQENMNRSTQPLLQQIQDKIQSNPVIKSNRGVIIVTLIGAVTGLIMSLFNVLLGLIIGAAIGYALCQKKVIDFFNKLIFENKIEDEKKY